MSTAQSAAEFFGMMLVPAIINRIGAKQGMLPDRAGDQPAFDYLRVNQRSADYLPGENRCMGLKLR
ncbi:Uncharacterised protein [Citrobacter koseri]|uniref:Uncharacterized protein n=1 Tax=Citrobacter koseri TaxID=545 RepID=A0A2X2UWW4_CITKO|nr:Uncharacterised protein [Citrobacter koseri]